MLSLCTMLTLVKWMVWVQGQDDNDNIAYRDVDHADGNQHDV